MQGKTINGFELKKLLGVGGMAEVWLAENEIHKRVAVKILNPELSHNETVVKRFRREAEIMVQLEHPNIRSAYSLGNIDGRPAIIMEYLEGTDLKKMLGENHRFTQEELVKWWNQLVDALNYTHAKEIVHRDIKPSNIFVDTDGNVKLLDFGIAKVCESSTKTRTGIMMGTLMYMSPEQVRNSKGVGPKSDAYSLAVTFVHLLTGQAPYESDSSDGYDIQENIVRKPLDISGVPSAWRSFLKPYLAKDPADRPALRAFEVIPEAPNDEDDGTIFEKGPNIPHSRPDDKPKGNNLLWILLGVVAVLILLIVLLWSKKPVDPDTKAFQDCQTVEDYRDYIDDYGPEALHYAEALDFIQRFMADSAQRVQDSLAQVQVERAETDAYRKCTTVRGCDNYLKTYPNGRYADQVSAKKAELEQKKAPTQRPTDDNPPQSVSQPQQQSQNHQQTTQNTPTVGNGGGSTSTTGIENGHEYVDLGLPSGTLWATCNVGASKPEDYGNYYAWGETSTKSTYEWNTYKYANGDKNKLTKYCNNSIYGNNGFTDNLTTLQTGDDPATANWGSVWQMPSKAQWEELLSNTTNTWTTRNGVKGRLFSSKKNGQTIFLPAAGCRWNNDFRHVGVKGEYWSRSLCYPPSADFLLFRSDNCSMNLDGRCGGFSVRPVRQIQGTHQQPQKQPIEQAQEQIQQPVSQITATTNSNQGCSTCSANGHEWVDLGLPSGTLWATCNIGASKPEGYGNYYAWGETSTKSIYDWDTYKYANGNLDKLTKYCNDPNFGNNGFTDKLTVLQGGDDPAVTKWGSGWRTPSEEQWEELLSNTTNQWTMKNGVKGCLFTSKKNGQTIFLPAAGERVDSELFYVNTHGSYWSRSVDTPPDMAFFLEFYSGYLNEYVSTGRYCGFTIRPVREK